MKAIVGYKSCGNHQNTGAVSESIRTRGVCVCVLEFCVARFVAILASAICFEIETVVNDHNYIRRQAALDWTGPED